VAQTWPEKSTLTSSLFVWLFSTSLLVQSLVTVMPGVHVATQLAAAVAVLVVPLRTPVPLAVTVSLFAHVVDE
jgi:hypothetical protein